ncbi:MAG: hypothetical protein HY344_02285 [Candidatus Levybacteria bacterium]|nr:hypothetical protein [Candidatus Levybacteria bacterium]
MSLTWKDLSTTLLALLTLGLYFAMTKGIDVPLISGYRAGILLLAFFGILMCASSPGFSSGSSVLVMAAGVLGFLALILIIYGLVTGTELAFTLLTVTILVLWAISTFRHFITK